MTDSPKQTTQTPGEKSGKGIIPPPRSENGPRPASFLTLSLLLHAAFLLLLAPLVFIPGDAATRGLDTISVTVLVDEGQVREEPASNSNETRSPERTIPATDPATIDIPVPDGDINEDAAPPGEPDGRENVDTDEVGTSLSGVSGNDPALSRYIARVRTRIEGRKYYPASSRRLKEEGTVTVSFLLTSSGDLVTLSVASSSGFPDLDDAALDAVKRASPYPPFPTALTATRLALKVPITYELQ